MFVLHAQAYFEFRKAGFLRIVVVFMSGNGRRRIFFRANVKCEFGQQNRVAILFFAPSRSDVEIFVMSGLSDELRQQRNCCERCSEIP